MAAALRDLSLASVQPVVDGSATMLGVRGISTVGEPAPVTERAVLIGESRSCRLIFTVFAEKIAEDLIRIISARKATRAERRKYEEDAV